MNMWTKSEKESEKIREVKLLKLLYCHVIRNTQTQAVDRDSHEQEGGKERKTAKSLTQRNCELLSGSSGRVSNYHVGFCHGFCKELAF